MSARGFSLIECLVATAILTVLVGAMFRLVDPAHGTFQAQPETADMQQRLRVAVDALTSALRSAGAGSLVGAARGPLARGVPAVLPYRIGERNPDPPAVRYRTDAISVVAAPLTGAQAVLRNPAATGDVTLTLDPGGSCPPPTAASVCGFTVGTRALVYDGYGAWDAFTVTGVAGDLLQIARPGGLSFSYAAGAVVTEAIIRSFALKTDATGEPQLSRYDGFQSEFPVVDNVVSLAFEYFGEPKPPERIPSVPLDQPIGPWTTYGPRPPIVDVDDPRDSWPTGESCTFGVAGAAHVPRLPALGAGSELVPLDERVLTDGPWCPDAASPGAVDADLFRIRRVRVRIRVQVASASLRGLAGALFRRAGHSTIAERLVPDQEIEFDVAPVNLAMGR